MDGVDILGEKVADGPLDKVGLEDEGRCGGLLLHPLLHLAPLVEEEAEVADKEAGLLSLPGGADDDAHSFRKGEFGEDLAEACPFLGILDLAGDAALVVEGHQDHVTARHGDVGGDARSFGADRPLGHLDHHLATDGVDVRDILGGEFFLGWSLFASPLNGLDAAVEGGGDGVPEVEEGVLLEADVDEHGLEAMLDVADLPLEDAADDVALAVALDGVFLQLAILEEGYAFFQLLTADDQFDAGS